MDGGLSERKISILEGGGGGSCGDENMKGFVCSFHVVVVFVKILSIVVCSELHVPNLQGLQFKYPVQNKTIYVILCNVKEGIFRQIKIPSKRVFELRPLINQAVGLPMSYHVSHNFIFMQLVAKLIRCVQNATVLFLGGFGFTMQKYGFFVRLKLV